MLHNSCGGGTLVVSVDMEPHADQGSLRQYGATCTRVFQLFNTSRLAATWAVSDPARSGAAKTILQASTAHEVAILGDPSWVGRKAGRPRFSRELMRRVHTARSAGVAVSTLSLRQVELRSNFDLLVKAGMTMVRPRLDTSSAGSSAKLRYGLYRSPVDFALASKGGWLASLNASVRRVLRRAVSNSQVVQLAIDLPQIDQMGNRGVHFVHRMLSDVANLRDRGDLQVKTLAELAHGMTPARRSSGSKSLLRRVA